MALCRHLTGRFGEAAVMAAEARGAGRDRHDPAVQLGGLLVLMESRLRVDGGDPAIAEWLEEADQLARQNVARIDVVRAQVAAARFHLAGGRPADAWHATRTAADFAGPGPSFAPYSLEAHAGIPEVCLTLLERGEPPGVDPVELRATAAAGLRRLRRYARSFPMAQPRTLVCLGWSYWLQGRRGAARRAWTRAIGEAERLAMPWELANAHHELGRHLAAASAPRLAVTGPSTSTGPGRASRRLAASPTRSPQPGPTARRPEHRSRSHGPSADAPAHHPLDSFFRQITGRWHGISAQRPRPQMGQSLGGFYPGRQPQVGSRRIAVLHSPRPRVTHGTSVRCPAALLTHPGTVHPRWERSANHGSTEAMSAELKEHPMPGTIPCPQCGAPAQITDRFRLGSTAGPVEHLQTGCVNNHWLTPLAETVASAQPDLAPAAATAVPA